MMGLYKNVKEIKSKLTAPEEQQNTRIKNLEEFITILKEEREDYLKARKHIDDLELRSQMAVEEHKKFSTTIENFAKLEQHTNDNFIKVNDALTSLIRDRINSYYFIKCTERGFITPIELEIVTDLYTAYSNAGGNGLISREMEIIKKIPVFNTEEEYTT